MPELKPLPFATLLRRLVYEYEREKKIFDLPATKFWRGAEGVSFGVRSHGKPAGTPFGPAAGPHTQMAQNIVLSWLAGARIIELKTIQINDRLTIPRPCIDATNVGYNVEFSQELRLEESLEEYVKAWMLIQIAERLGVLNVTPRQEPTQPEGMPHFYDCIFDLSCGYNLEGIASDRVTWFIRSMIDASAEIERLRRQIPTEFRALLDVEFDPHIVSTATLSTFHGCPPHEIEGIVEHLLRVHGLHVVIKMNPTMLGRERVEELLHRVLGFEDIQPNPEAFESGLQFDEAIGLVRRLRKLAYERGLDVGVKFTNTLEVVNHRDFFPPSEKIMYLSGAPLYPMAVELAHKFREAYVATATEPWEAELPISFSAGVDKHNFADCVAAGMVPVTVCTDLLKPGGYGRAIDYLQALANEMKSLGCESIEDFILRASGTTFDRRTASSANLRRAWEKAL
ncbi:MAG: glutamate synthase, partial [Candidatus Sumerlaeaceae bacterium]